MSESGDSKPKQAEENKSFLRKNLLKAVDSLSAPTPAYRARSIGTGRLITLVGILAVTWGLTAIIAYTTYEAECEHEVFVTFVGPLRGADDKSGVFGFNLNQKLGPYIQDGWSICGLQNIDLGITTTTEGTPLTSTSTGTFNQGDGCVPRAGGIDGNGNDQKSMGSDYEEVKFAGPNDANSYNLYNIGGDCDSDSDGSYWKVNKDMQDIKAADNLATLDAPSCREFIQGWLVRCGDDAFTNMIAVTPLFASVAVAVITFLFFGITAGKTNCKEEFPDPMSTLSELRENM